MKKLLTVLCTASLMLSVFAPQAKALITDPDDYLIFDTGPVAPIGILANAPDTFIFNAEGDGVRFLNSDGVVFKKEAATWGRGMKSSEQVAALGWTGFDYTVSSTELSYLWIPEDEKAPYVFTKLEWKNITRGRVKEYSKAKDLDPYRWWYNEASTNYNRPSDSIVVRIPAGCDSVFIQAGGTNSGYGILVYQKDQGFDNGWFNGGNWGMGFNEIGFKPVPNGEDSIDIVIIGSFKDWFTGLNQTRWKDNGSISFQQVSLATALTDYQESERWGQFRGVGINRIKIYGKIEPSVVPPFDGTVAGWDFKYEPKSSGTVDLDKPVGDLTIDEANIKSKYASDLGIKRFMMTTDKGFYVGNDQYIQDAPLAQLLINEHTQKDSLGGYTYYPTNYFNFEGKADGCQELSFNFDFALYEAGSKILVLGLPIDSTSWEILGEYEYTDPECTTLASVSQKLPDTYTNKSFALRIMVAADQTYSIVRNTSSLYIANVSIKGYNDYSEKNEDAPKIAYISNATDRIHIMGNAVTADSTDAFFKSLYTSADYNVKVFTQEDAKALTNEDTVKAAFKDYDLVILSAYPGADSEIVKNAKYLIGYKPILNLNAAAIASWGLGYTLQEGDADTMAYLADNSYNGHPAFKDLSLSDKEDGKMYLPCIFNSKDNGTNYFCGLDFTSAPQTVRALANGINDGINCIVEDYSNESKKHIFVGIPDAQNMNLNSKATTLLKNTMSYLMSSGYYEAPTFELTSDGAIVNNTTELQAALAYNYSIIGISNPVIYLNTSTDADAVYTLGEMKVKNAVSLKPSEGATVNFEGSFTPVSTNVGSITFNNVNFTSAVPFTFSGKNQKLTKGLFFNSCTFSNVSTIISTEGSDSCQVKAISVNNCTFKATSDGSLIDVKDCFELDSIYFAENFVETAQPKQLLSWAGTHPNDSNTVAIYVEHNQFMSSSASPEASFISYSVSTFETGHATVNNNIFYKQGTAGISLPQGIFTSTQALNNLAIETAANWQAMDTISTLTLEGLGIADPFADGIDSKIINNSVLYHAGTNRTYVGKKSLYIDRSIAETITVKNFNQLKDALEIAIDGDVIELADYEMSETDSINAYVLTGLALPTNGANLVIRNAEGATPKVIGNILGSSSANLGNLTIIGLNWIVDDTLANYASDTYTAAFITTKNYTVSGTLSFYNCTFKDQEKPIFRMKGKDATDGSYIGKLIIKGCTIDNHGGKVLDGESGGHLIQLDKADVYTFNNFEFTENYVTNFHGGQVFNLSRQGSASENDKAIKYVISNNIFYAFGGAAKSLRNFLEFNQTPALCSVDITIANNIFYDRYSTDGSAVAYIDLYTSGTQLSNKVLVTNNFYAGKYYAEGTELGTDNPVSPDATSDSGEYNLKQKNDNGDIVVTYEEQMNTSTLGIEHDDVFTEDEELRIAKTSPLFTAGTNSSYMGPDRLYTGQPVTPVIPQPAEKSCDKPVVSQSKGEGKTTVTFTCTTDQASFYYTLDGSDPTDASLLYEAPFEISEDSTIVKVIAMKEGFKNSEITVACIRVDGKKLELGDINGDYKVNVGDMTGLVNLILGIPTEGLHEEVADVNEDGKINVGDCVALTNKILNTSNVASLNAGVISARVFADDFSLAAGESFDMAINFAGAENISAMQMDITLPAGLTFESARMAGSSHSLAVATLSNGNIRVLGYSSENAMMNASSLIVTVRADASAAGMGRVELGNILVAGSNAAVTGLDDAYATVTFSVQSGLESVMNEESREVYNILGQKVNDGNLRSGVYVINGKKTVVR